MALNIPVILGSVRDDRVGIQPATFLVKFAESRGHRARLVDPKTEFQLPLLNKMYKEYEKGQAPELLERLATIIREADAILVCSAEYNHSIPPALSNLMDHFLDIYSWKVAGITCYSPSTFGGVRAAMQLRCMLGEMGMPTIPSILPFPKVTEMVDEDGNATSERLTKNASRFFDELEWYAEAVKAKRAEGTPY